MRENQFVKFSPSIDLQDNELPMPVVPGETGLEFYSPLTGVTPTPPFQQITIALVTADGGQTLYSEAVNYTNDHLALFGDTTTIPAATLLELMPYNGLLFRIKLTKVALGVTYTQYSNVLVVQQNQDKELALLRYRCGETTAGFPFKNGEWVSAWMPIWLDQMQYRQEDETYTRLDGSVAVLYATRTKEYEAETDYIPEEWHEKILTALMSDDVTINGQGLQKSADYELQWDSVLKTRHHKCVKATWKMIERTLTRNSNE